MSTAAALRSPLFHQSNPAFDMRDSSGITLPPIRAVRSSRPSLELPSMKAILAVASSHFFATDRHHHYGQPSSTEHIISLSSTIGSQTTSASTIARFEKESAAHPPMCEYLCHELSIHNGMDAGTYRPRLLRHRSALSSSTEAVAPASPECPLCHSDRAITTLLPYY